MITIRRPDEIFKIKGEIEGGSFLGRWHFSFDTYTDSDYMRFGTLRVFNDDTISPGGVWPLHPHKEIEVVTYCAAGEFRHADQAGKGGVLKKGWVQHTTVGRGMWHSEINNLKDEPMRFIQMWFIPDTPGLEPALQQMRVDKSARTDIILPIVSNEHEGALPIHSDARVYSSFLTQGKVVEHIVPAGHGTYFYLVEGGPVHVNTYRIEEYSAIKAVGPGTLEVHAEEDSELLLVDVRL
jgi:quercetin 2,3-dioxygenase